MYPRPDDTPSGPAPGAAGIAAAGIRGTAAPEGAAARCARCGMPFEPASWIEKRCPPCEVEARRSRVALALLALAALALTVLFGIADARSGGTDPGGARRALVPLVVLGAVLCGGGALWMRRDLRARRAAAGAAGDWPRPRARRAPLGGLALAWAIAGVSLVAFPLGAGLAGHWASGARGPLTLLWLTVSQPTGFAGAGVWGVAAACYLGVSLLAAAVGRPGRRP